MRHRLNAFFGFVGEIGIFGLRAIRDAFRPPFEFGEILNQVVEIGWRTGPLVLISGFAFGVVIALVTLASMMTFGAQAMIPEAISLGLFKDTGALITALLVSGRAGAGIGAQLAGMRVTEQIDALETLGVDSFKYLVVTRIAACVIAIPILTTLFNFAGMAGGLISDLMSLHITARLFIAEAFGSMAMMSDYVLPTAKTVVFGFIIGTISCYLGYTASQGAAGVGRASTRSVVFSSVLVILVDAVLVRTIMIWYPG
ncbi:MAG TPA: ABC transporter permease [Terracidiphilus sp.]|nr:ABC transporter permease [Terracidiphilus sp.]